MSKKSKNLTHSLIDNVSGKLLNLRLSDKHLISETGNDFNTKTFLHSFDLQHVVKTCNIKFVGEKLGVRSDYGCFSIYNV